MTDERRLNQLIIKEATGNITAAERQELEGLDARRTLDEPSHSGDAIQARERLLSKMQDLIQELSQFGNTPATRHGFTRRA